MVSVAFVKNRNFIGNVTKHDCFVEYSNGKPLVVAKATQALPHSKATKGCGIIVMMYQVRDYEFYNGTLYLIGKDINSFDTSMTFDYNTFKQSDFANIPVTL